MSAPDTVADAEKYFSQVNWNTVLFNKAVNCMSVELSV